MGYLQGRERTRQTCCRWIIDRVNDSGNCMGNPVVNYYGGTPKPFSVVTTTRGIEDVEIVRRHICEGSARRAQDHSNRVNILIRIGVGRGRGNGSNRLGVSRMFRAIDVILCESLVCGGIGEVIWAIGRA